MLHVRSFTLLASTPALARVSSCMQIDVQMVTATPLAVPDLFADFVESSISAVDLDKLGLSGAFTKACLPDSSTSLPLGMLLQRQPSQPVSKVLIKYALRASTSFSLRVSSTMAAKLVVPKLDDERTISLDTLPMRIRALPAAVRNSDSAAVPSTIRPCFPPCRARQPVPRPA